MSPRRIAPLAAVLAVALPAAPAAAHSPAWSEPEPVPASVDAFPDLAFAPDGSGAVTWSATSAADAMQTQLNRTDADDRFGAPSPLPGGFDVGLARPSGRDGLVLAGALRGEERARPAVSIGTVDAPGPPRPLLPSTRSGSLLDVATNARGDVAALFTRCRAEECSTHDLFLRVRRAGGGFGPSMALERREKIHEGAVTVDARGTVKAAWEQPRTGVSGTRLILARTRSASGRLGAPQTLGTATPTVSLEAATTIEGTAVVGWLGQRVSEGDALGPATIQAAVARRGRGFGAAQRLETVDVRGTGRYVGQAGIRLAPDPAGSLVVAWTGHRGGRFVVRAASLDGSRIRGARVVSDSERDTVLSDVAVGPQGEAAVLMLGGIRGADASGPVGVVAAVRGPGTGVAAFGAPEAVSHGAHYVEGAQAAFNPVSRRLVAVWRDPFTRRVETARRLAL